MKNEFLEAGQIVNTHGILGEVKIVPWCDCPDMLCDLDTLYMDGKPIRLHAARVHKKNVLATIEGVDYVEAAMALKNKMLFLRRDQITLPPGRHFLADLMGLTVIDNATGEELGKIADILTPPAHEVYVVKGGPKSYLIPAVDAFLAETNIEAGYVKINLIEGLEADV